MKYKYVVQLYTACLSNLGYAQGNLEWLGVRMVFKVQGSNYIRRGGVGHFSTADFTRYMYLDLVYMFHPVRVQKGHCVTLVATCTTISDR